MFEHGVRAATLILMFGVMPLWLLAGLVDYLCHRASSIETTSGAQESALHLLQLSLVGFPIFLALFLEIDAALLALMIACLLLHHIVAYVDVRYANATRQVTPFEQMVHSFLELLPLTALLLVCVLHWDQLLALFGAGHTSADFSLRLNTEPLPPEYLVAIIAAAFLLNWVPFLEEMIRTLRAAQKPSHSPER
jgi:hypothetical protein